VPSGRPISAFNDEKSATILQSFIKMPNTSTRKVVTKNEFSQSSVCNIKKNRFYPYKMLYVQELIHENFDWRIVFCELIEARGNDFVNNIVFSEQSRFKFQIFGNVNCQNNK